MSDSDGKKPLGVTPRPGSVKQSFSHGRTKNVVVETKRKRVVVPKPGTPKPAGSGSAPLGGDPSKRPAGISDVEMARRMKALQLAKAREVEDAAKRDADDKERAEQREIRRAEIDAKERKEKEREEAVKAKKDEEEQKKRDAEVAAQAAA
ncbi:MAG: translation initiation factor IF-2 associated domain-containing protein, partial [Octadecabacter sp.]